MRHRMPTGKAT